MRRALRLLPLLTLLVLTTVLLTHLQTRRNTAVAQGTVHTLWGVYWSVEPGFTSTLEMKNNRISDQITAHVSLYFSNGEEFVLNPVILGPRETVVLSINDIHRDLPRWVAARASREGTVEVAFTGPNASAMMGSVSVINSRKRTAWNFFLYPERPGLGVAPLQGVFWFPSERTQGFVALQNISEQSLIVHPIFHVGGRQYPADPMYLLPEQGLKFDVQHALARLGVDREAAGGLEFTYEGAPDALRAHGVLFDGEGYSAEVDFLRSDAQAEQTDYYFRAPRVAVGSADPVLGLPADTHFRPHLVLHNFNNYPLDVRLALGVRQAAGSREFTRLITLNPGETRVLEPHRAVVAQVPNDVHWASLELSYRDAQNGLGMMLVSTSAEPHRSIRSVLNWVESTSREGWIWRADQQHNTLLGIFNSEAEDARVAISLDYYEGGVHHRYDLPERVIPRRSADLLNIKEVIDARIPDKDGEVIPPSVTFGGYRARKIAPTTGGNLTTEALLFDRAGSAFLSIYNTGCCQEKPFIVPDSITGNAGGSGQFQVFAADVCTGEPIDLTYDTSMTFYSTAPSVAFGDYGGYMHLGSPGTAYVTATAKHPIPWNYVCRTQPEESWPCFVTVKPQITSISPGRGLIGSTTAVTINGIGFGTSPTVQAGSGITVSISSAADTQIQASFAVSSSAPAGNHAVTVTAAGQTSNSVNFFVQVPTSLSIVPGTDSTTAEAACTTSGGLAGCGVTRTFTYQVKDQAGQAIQASLEFWDTITTTSPNNLNLQSYKTTCPGNTGPCGVFTFPDGTLSETLYVCAPACKSGSVCIIAGSTGADQVWHIGGYALTSDVKHLSYECNRILVNNQ